MKHYFWTICLLLLLIPGNTWSASPNFLIMDQLSNNVIMIGSDLKPLSTFKAGPGPSVLEPLPGDSGYALLCNGTKNLLGTVSATGELIYLDSSFKPTQHKITFPGLIIQNYYFKAEATWIFVAQNKTANSLIRPTATVIIVNLKNGTENHFSIDSIPTAYQFNADRSIFAFTVLSSNNKTAPSQCILIDLHLQTMKSFQVSANPAGIYFINDHQILVACAGFGNSSRYSSTIAMDHFDKPVTASLYWIDITSGDEQISNLGYSPMVIIQDKKAKDTFYVASPDNLDSKAPQSTFYLYCNGIKRSELKLPCDIVQLVPVKSGNICLYGRHDFYIIHIDNGKIVAHFRYDLSIDKLLLNSEQNVGYVAAVNSNYIDKIDLTTGTLMFKFKISSSLFGGMMGISGLFPQKLPPVSGMILPVDDKTNFLSDNNRMLMTDDCNRLYTLASRGEVSGINLKNGLQVSSCKFIEGKPYGIHFTPDKKFVVVAADTIWYLLKPEQKKPIFSLPLPSGDGLPTTGYYSPDGNLLVIPSNGYFYFIDCQNCRLAGKLQTKVQKSVVTWLP
ncbi:MAG TPA: hypothetical protein DDW50_04450 [Firmicutes bacterium]|jgi:DNA-binding beta-propeller fold protein YncE|nr:hypothetical protein [Bacillota bacterium]